MGRKNHFLNAALAMLVSFGSVISGVSPVMADELVEKKPDELVEKKPAVFIQVSPPKTQLGELTPGKTYSDKFIVQNVGGGRFNYKVYTTPYYVTGDDYSPVYNLESNYSKIKDWFTFDKTEGTLDPQEEETVSYTVTVPNDAPLSGQYAAIMVETGDGNEENATIKTISRVGIIVLSHVGGETKGCTKVLSNSIQTFMFEPPINASSLIENCGNVDSQVSYTMKVTPLFSNEPIYDTTDSPKTRDTFPETKLYNTQKWDESPSIGIFWVEQAITFGAEPSVVKQLVVICPMWLLFLIIGIIFFIIFWLVSRAMSRKKKDQQSRGAEEKK
ncbi:MAG: hypothetical protein Q4F60_00160 [Candidatus Saccharibacteria bacterium]|nr:hypothetical protein [Candidatus Saccharibacteria bacterium]